MSIQYLNGKWEFRDASSPNALWFAAKVPGDIHLDLFSNKLIPDPFQGLNSKLLGEFEKKKWLYRKKFTFKLPAPPFLAKLTFHGIEGIADIFLNKHFMGRTENSFVPHSFEAASQLCNGENILELHLTDGLEQLAGKDLEKYTGLKINSNSETPEARIWLRKPQFSFGWDWAPRLINCGIWRNVTLESSGIGFVEDFAVRTTLNRNYTKAAVHYSFNWSGLGKDSVAAAEIVISHENKIISTHPFSMKSGRNQGKLTLNNPRLWYPRGYGMQAIYTARVQVGRTPLASTAFGIRNVKVIERKVTHGGRTFIFAVNGRKVFCQGANWVPTDSIIGRASDKKTNYLLAEAVKCNFNMLRVWGGGVYESDFFYQRCDELGIMVWQDFMYSCALYPDDDPIFFQNCKTEAVKVIKLLRNHPSIVVWCGNNEVHDAYLDVFKPLGIKVFYGGRIWDELLPELLNKYLPKAIYRPASPFGGSYHRSELAGDAHSLMCALTLDDSTDIRTATSSCGRLNSEYYSWNSPPPLKSIRRYLEKDQLRSNSPGYLHHANTMYHAREFTAMKRYACGAPEVLSFEQYIDLMQRLHGFHMQLYTDSFRRHMSLCSGALFWMFNECWPTSGWGTHDYYGERKAFFYYIKRSFADIRASFQLDHAGLSVWISNNSEQKFIGSLKYGRRNFRDGAWRVSYTHNVEVKPRSSKKAGFFYTELYWPWEALRSFGWLQLSDMEGNLIDDDVYLFSSIKGLSGQEFSFSPDYWAADSIHSPQLRIKAAKRQITVSSDVPAFGVQIAEIFRPHDNYFNLMPDESKTIGIENFSSSPNIIVSTLNARIIEMRNNPELRNIMTSFL